MFKFLEKNPKAENKDTAEREKAVKMQKRIAKYARYDEATLYAIFSSSLHGMNDEEVDDSRDEFGRNHLDRGKKVSVFKRVWDSFINPFTLVLLSLAVVSAFTDIIFASPGEKNQLSDMAFAPSVNGDDASIDDTDSKFHTSTSRRNDVRKGLSFLFGED